jgi:1-deoxy-D-xylulose-5-phosphate synthase
VRFCKGTVPADIPAVATVGGLDVLVQPDDEPADVLIAGVGAMAGTCVEAARILAGHGIGVTVVDPRWVKPLDGALRDLALRHGLVVVVEDNGEVGGVGDEVARLIRDTGTPIRTFGIPQRFLSHASRESILAEIGLDAQQLAREIAETITGTIAGRSPSVEMADAA